MSVRRAVPALALGALASLPMLAYTGRYMPGTGIAGTPHDLSLQVNGLAYTAVPADAKTRVCIFCHAPHNAYVLAAAAGGPPSGVGSGPRAPSAADEVPLWNHALPADAAYAMYDPGPGAPTVGHAAPQSRGAQVPGSVSLLCLSCHDGSVAVNAYGNVNQLASSLSSGTTTMAAAYVIGKGGFLGNHHPVGFSYGAVQAADREIRPPTQAMGLAGSVASHLYSSEVLGATDTMECGTCHSVHNTGNTGPSLLWRSDTNSRLCLTCHVKGNDPGDSP